MLVLGWVIVIASVFILAYPSTGGISYVASARALFVHYYSDEDHSREIETVCENFTCLILPLLVYTYKNRRTCTRNAWCISKLPVFVHCTY